MRGLPPTGRAVPARFWLRLRRLLPNDTGASGKELLRLAGHLPAGLRERALTHSSQVAERVDSNERLEFLGDSVLGLAITTELYHRYPEWDEGDLARLKAFAVSRASCAKVAGMLGVRKMMTDARGELRSGSGRISHSKAVSGNALEALIGAVFLTFGFEQVRAAVVEAFEEELRGGPGQHIDAKTALQELLAARGLQPEYQLVSESGPAHAKTFGSEVYVAGVLKGQGVGTTIKMSEQQAAKHALESYGVNEGEA